MALRFITLVAILALNAFFSAAEVALVVARRSKLEDLARQGNLGARAALEVLANPERLLSVTQVGVTLASLALGWAGDQTMHQIILWLYAPLLTPVTEAILHGSSFVLAFMITSFFHVVIGEVVPKNLALDQADRLALLVAPPLLVFEKVSAPFVFVVEWASTALSRLLGIRWRHGGGHSAEELKFIIEASGREGHLEGFEEGSLSRLLGLKEVYAREIMTPRVNIVSVPVTAGLDDILQIALEHKYSRLPVYEGKPENIIGIVHYKDLMRAWQERKMANDARRPARPFVLRRYLRKPLVVPETKPLHHLVDEFRQRHTHLALVVDEFGTITGLVTMEDVLEQIFGEIGDEHDVRRFLPAAGAPVIEVDGSTTILDLASRYGIQLPGDAGFETLAGFILYRLGNLPAPGDSVTYGEHTFTVVRMDRNRIARVKIVRQQAPEPAKAASPANPSSREPSSS
jgi:CBS domain containing-hemolysin-like protein